MVSFSCEVCCPVYTALVDAPIAAQWALHAMEAIERVETDGNCCELELWGCPHQEEAGSPSQPVLWRLVHLLGLHGAL